MFHCPQFIKARVWLHTCAICNSESVIFKPCEFILDLMKYLVQNYFYAVSTEVLCYPICPTFNTHQFLFQKSF